MWQKKPELPGFITGVDARIAPATLRPGQAAMLTLTLTIKPTYHIYANNLGDRFLTPTVLTPEKRPGIRFGKIGWPQPQRHDKALVYEKSAVFKIPFAVEPGASVGKNELVIEVRAQGCNETDCFPPARFLVSAPMRIERR